MSSNAVYSPEDSLQMYVKAADENNETKITIEKYMIKDVLSILAQYRNLRKCFQKLINDVLGKKYYNMANDVCRADEICCEDIRARTCTRNCYFRK